MSIEMKPSLYIETTIPSYLAARTSNDLIIAGRQSITHEFWITERNKYHLYISDYVYRECSRGDAIIAKKRLSYIEGIEIINDPPDVLLLADTYMRLLTIPHKNRIDASHLAICSINRIDILLSWNYSHMGVEAMQILQRYNDAHDLHTPRLTTPDAMVSKYKEVVLDA